MTIQQSITARIPATLADLKTVFQAAWVRAVTINLPLGSDAALVRVDYACQHRHARQQQAGNVTITSLAPETYLLAWAVPLGDALPPDVEAQLVTAAYQQGAQDLRRLVKGPIPDGADTNAAGHGLMAAFGSGAYDVATLGASTPLYRDAGSGEWGAEAMIREAAVHGYVSWLYKPNRYLADNEAAFRHALRTVWGLDERGGRSGEPKQPHLSFDIAAAGEATQALIRFS